MFSVKGLDINFPGPEFCAGPDILEQSYDSFLTLDILLMTKLM